MTSPAASSAVAGRRAGWLAFLFGITAFVAASLLFVVQPLVARTMLPVLGGSASVWNSAMVTFQVLLLGGYLLAHLSVTRLPARVHAPVVVAFALVAAVALPVGLRAGWRPSGSEPAVWTIGAVAAAVGLPFLALACVSPTLQRWYADVRPDVDPYVLYSAGNAGSFVGLLAYPLVIERATGIGAQQGLWSAGYALFLVLFGICGALAWRAVGAGAGSRLVGSAGAVPAASSSTRPAPAQFLRWVGMSAGPSLLLLGVTRHIATDVAAIPLLWVLPLSLYLLTFVLVFSGRGPALVDGAERLGLVLAAVVMVSLTAMVPGAFGIGLHLVTFALLTLATHGRLVASRPDASQLTSFYLAMSLGGAVGGLVGGLVAPLVFPSILEYPLGLVACVVWLRPRLALGPRVRVGAMVAAFALVVVALVLRWGTSDVSGPSLQVQLALGLAVFASFMWSRRGWEAALVLALVAAVAVVVPDPQMLVRLRTYYGVTRVLEGDDGRVVMLSGTTVHGSQDPGRPGEALEYYATGAPLRDVFDHTATGAPRSVGVVGLGAGSMAAWLGADDEIVFYEIDPAVIAIATDPDVFSYLADSPARVEVAEGDGRLALAAGPAVGRHDLVYIDAFSSDAIPVHLVTREALAVYRQALRPEGVVVFHVSNRHFDLRPVVARLADDAGLVAMTRTARGLVEGSALTTAVAVGPEDRLANLAEVDGWVRAEPGPDLWTDEQADVLGALESF